MRTFRLSLAAALVLALAACDGGDLPADSASPDGIANEPLPAPAGAAGAVTGMPGAPGPNEIRSPDDAPAPEPAPEVALDANGDPLPADAPPDAPVDPALADASAVPAEAAPAAVDPAAAQEAVALVRDYHAAINGAAYGRAYGLWADAGRASGQTPQQFADSFAPIEGMSVEIGMPGRADPTTARVPVTLTVRRHDGVQRRLEGHYTLRRPAEAAAAADATAWRIASMTLREGAP